MLGGELSEKEDVLLCQSHWYKLSASICPKMNGIAAAFEATALLALPRPNCIGTWTYGAWEITLLGNEISCALVSLSKGAKGSVLFLCLALNSGF